MATKRDEIYMCSLPAGTKCTCLTEMLADCTEACAMSCCNQPMTLVEPKRGNEGKEKHVPVIEKVAGGYKVKIGSIPHPMEPDHFIQFIELRAAGELHRKYLKPGQAPEAIFKVDADQVTAIEFCNKHGVWAS